MLTRYIRLPKAASSCSPKTSSEALSRRQSSSQDLAPTQPLEQRFRNQRRARRIAVQANSNPRARASSPSAPSPAPLSVVPARRYGLISYRADGACQPPSQDARPNPQRHLVSRISISALTPRWYTKVSPVKQYVLFLLISPCSFP